MSPSEWTVTVGRAGGGALWVSVCELWVHEGKRGRQ